MTESSKESLKQFFQSLMDLGYDPKSIEECFRDFNQENYNQDNLNTDIITEINKYKVYFDSLGDIIIDDYYIPKFVSEEPYVVLTICTKGIDSIAIIGNGRDYMEIDVENTSTLFKLIVKEFQSKMFHMIRNKKDESINKLIEKINNI